MKHGKSFVVTVTILTVFLTVVSISFIDNRTVFAQNSLFGNDNGGLVGNMFRNFGNVVGNLGISNLNPPILRLLQVLHHQLQVFQVNH